LRARPKLIYRGALTMWPEHDGSSATSGLGTDVGRERTGVHSRNRAARHPEYVARHFERWLVTPGCRRSGCTISGMAPATLALASGADLKTVSEMRPFDHHDRGHLRDRLVGGCPACRRGRGTPRAARATDRSSTARSHLGLKWTLARRPRGRKARSEGCAARDLNPQPAD
jgi:hypothetical protein